MKVFRAFKNFFKVPQRNVKIKIYLNFFALFGIGAVRVKNEK